MIVFWSAVLVITGRLDSGQEVCLTGGHLVLFHTFTRKKLGTRCSRDFAYATGGELSSTIMNFFGRLTM